jgi:hypothetical protein
MNRKMSSGDNSVRIHDYSAAESIKKAATDIHESSSTMKYLSQVSHAAPLFPSDKQFERCE